MCLKALSCDAWALIRLPSCLCNCCSYAIRVGKCPYFGKVGNRHLNMISQTVYRKRPGCPGDVCLMQNESQRLVVVGWLSRYVKRTDWINAWARITFHALVPVCKSSRGLGRSETTTVLEADAVNSSKIDEEGQLSFMLNQLHIVKATMVSSTLVLDRKQLKAWPTALSKCQC